MKSVVCAFQLFFFPCRTVSRFVINQMHPAPHVSLRMKVIKKVFTFSREHQVSCCMARYAEENPYLVAVCLPTVLVDESECWVRCLSVCRLA